MAKNIELLSYEHDDFDIHVSTDNLDSPRNKLKRTYVSRSVELPKYDEMLVWVGSQPMLPSFDSEGPPHIQPFFFENRQNLKNITGAHSYERKESRISETKTNNYEM